MSSRGGELGLSLVGRNGVRRPDERAAGHGADGDGSHAPHHGVGVKPVTYCGIRHAMSHVLVASRRLCFRRRNIRQDSRVKVKLS